MKVWVSHNRCQQKLQSKPAAEVLTASISATPFVLKSLVPSSFR